LVSSHSSYRMIIYVHVRKQRWRVFEVQNLVCLFKDNYSFGTPRRFLRKFVNLPERSDDGIGRVVTNGNYFELHIIQ